MSLRTTAVFALLGLLLAACSPSATTPPDDAPEDAATPEAPEPEPAEPEAPEEPDQHANRIEIFFVRATEDRIWVEPVVRFVVGDEDELEYAAVTELFTGEPDDPDLSTSVPRGIEVLEVTRAGDVLVIDVAETILATSGGSAQEIAFAEQLAHTAAAIDGITSVQLTVAGSSPDSLWGHLDWSAPFQPDPFALTPITIVEPRYDTRTVVGQLDAHGRATVFEAEFTLRLLAADGSVIDEVVVMATEGGPGRGDWIHSFTIDAPGEYVLEAVEHDPSGGEGRAPLVLRRGLTVTQ